MIGRRTLLSAVPSLLCVGAASAARVRPFSAPDPGGIYLEKANVAYTQPNADVSGKTPRALAINGAENTLIMICAGQSLAANLIADTFTPVNGSKLDNLGWYDGRNWAAANPLIGTYSTSHNFNFKIADGLISNGKFDRVIIVPVAMSGTSVNQWVNDYTTEPTGYYRMIQAAAKKLAAQGVTPSTPGVKFLLKWNQGESDTQGATSQVNYTADFNKLVSLCATDLPGVKWMVAKESWYIGAVSTAVQNAQTALVNGTTIFAGENMDSLDATKRTGDNTHLNATGGSAAATLGIAAITAITF